MENILNRFNDTVQHLQALHETFIDEHNFPASNIIDHQIYTENLTRLGSKLTELKNETLLYGLKGRQMILSDFFEYVFFGRIYYSMKKDIEEQEILFRLY